MDPVVLAQADCLQPFVACLERRGISAERHLERQRISPEQVARGEGMILRGQAHSFFMEVVARESFRELGFLGDDPFSIHDFGGLGAMLGEAVTLKDAIDTFAAIISCFVQDNTVWLEEGPEISWLCCRGEWMDLEVFPADHFTPVVLAAIVRMAGGPDWRPEEIRFQTGPSEILGRSSFSSGIRPHFFQRGSGVAFHSNLLSAPVLPNGDQNANDGSESLAPAPLPFESTGQAIEGFVASRLPFHGLPTIDEAAELLGVHRTTLFRSLKSEGLTWSRLIDRTRARIARERLTASDMSIKEIACELCYTNPGNFIRAFRRMTGMTPNEYRLRLEGGASDHLPCPPSAP